MKLATAHQLSESPMVISQIPELLSYITDRMGKIMQATLMIERIIPENPLVHAWTTETLLAVQKIHSIEQSPENATITDVQSLMIHIRHVMNYQTWCHTAGILSDMNYQILNRELQTVIDYIHQRIETYCAGSGTYPFRAETGLPSAEKDTSAIMDIFGESSPEPVQKIKPEPIQKNPPTEPTEQRTPSAHNNGQEKEKPTPKNYQTPILSPITKHHHRQPDDLFPQQTKIIAPISGEDKKDRRDAIMKTIRAKGKVTIKDIAENITGCSEKTIQRDLQELIQHGVLTREGEKRWAVYMLSMKNG